MLPSNLKNIKFNWMNFGKELNEHHIDIVNTIPNYYHVEILLFNNSFGDDGIKWPMHVAGYKEDEWSFDTYEIQDKYIHPIYGPITILINKETYQPYSSVKSALK